MTQTLFNAESESSAEQVVPLTAHARRKSLPEPTGVSMPKRWAALRSAFLGHPTFIGERRDGSCLYRLVRQGRTNKQYRTMKIIASTFTLIAALVVTLEHVQADTLKAEHLSNQTVTQPDSRLQTLEPASTTLAEAPPSANPVSAPVADVPAAYTESTATPAAPVYTPLPVRPARANIPAQPAIGPATEKLLAMQRDNQGPARPISGTEAAVSYARYLKSFEHEIPEKYESNVNKIGGSSGGSR